MRAVALGSTIDIPGGELINGFIKAVGTTETFVTKFWRYKETSHSVEIDSGCLAIV
jgi:hypothetical protein